MATVIPFLCLHIFSHILIKWYKWYGSIISYETCHYQLKPLRSFISRVYEETQKLSGTLKGTCSGKVRFR